VTALYYLTAYRWRWALLLAASCVFYMALYPPYIFILFGIIAIDYTAAIFIEQSEGLKRKLYLALSVFLNLGVLCFFKYFHLFARIAEWLNAHYHLSAEPLPYANIILPLGLSFHTFQSMSYTIEVYRGNYKAERHLGFYALYVMFYPQLVAGPIERPAHLLPQLHTDVPFRYENLWQGLRLMLWGLFKKVVIADRVVGYVNPIFNHPAQYHNLQVLIGVLAFTIQIYCDFSGYSDMALGAAKCMGFDLMLNFRRPYAAANIREFWSRWHISLSTWFRDYVYKPLGGNRRGKLRLYLNVMIVFILSGIWHGTNRIFIAWGAIHAFYFLIYLSFSSLCKPLTGRLWNVFSWVLTFFVVALAWIFFRAEDLPTATLILSKIFAADKDFYLFIDLEYFKAFSVLISLLMISYMIVIERITDSRLEWFKDRSTVDILFCGITLFLILSFGVFNHQTFIYFQF
jgi:D-alanyl-lipoteichoic acid acyltransferase DltB (MBOAT superfamily)